MASRYFINGDGTGLWGNTANWSTVSGGAGGSSVPTSADAVFLDASSPSCTVSTPTSPACQSLTCTGYTQALVVSATNGLTVAGNVTLAAAMTLTGSGPLTVGTTSTFTANGCVVACPLVLNGAATITLGDNVTATGGGTLGGSGNSGVTLNGNTLNWSGNLLFGSSGGTVLGTTTLNLNGTTTLTSNGGTVRLNITINTAGTVTFTGTINYQTGTLTYTAGTVITAGSTLALTASATLNTGSSVVWNNLSATGNSTTVTLSSDLYTSGLLTLGASNADGIALAGAGVVYCQGSLRSNISNGVVSGRTVHLTGTGTWDMPNLTASTTSQGFRSNLIINTAGTITITGFVCFNTGTLTYTAGTVITTGSTLLLAVLGCTLDTGGMHWYNVTCGLNTGVTLTSALNIDGLALFGSGSSGTGFNGAAVNLYGSLRIAATTGFVNGNSAFNFVGTGTWDTATSAAGYLGSTVTINTTGTLTISGPVYYQASTLTYTAGTVVATGSILHLQATTAINTNAAGVTWGTFQIATAITVTFGGTSGWTAEGIINRASTGGTFIFTSTLTYILTNYLVLAGAPGNTNTFRASTASSAAFVKFTGFVQFCFLQTVTDIDSSGGNPLYVVRGTLTRTTNWTTQSPLRVPTAPYVYL